jgi:hypothetical protein
MKSVTYISHRRRFNLFSKSFHLKTIFEKIFLVDFVFLPLCLKIKRIYSYGFKTIDRRVRYEMLQAVFIGHLKCNFVRGYTSAASTTAQTASPGPAN